MPRKPAFAESSIAAALERSIRNAPQLKARQSALVAAARVYAKRLDALTEAGFCSDAGKMDNVTMPTFLKLLEAMGLGTEEHEPSASKKLARQAENVSELEKFRSKHNKVG